MNTIITSNTAGNRFQSQTKWVLYTVAIATIILYSLMGETSTQAQDETSTNAPEIEVGLAHHANGNYEDAIEAFTTAINQQIQPFQAYIGRGRAYIELGEYRTAVDDFTQAIELNPISADAYIRRGEAYAFLRKFEALADLDRAIELNPQSSEAYVLRGHVLDYLDDYLAAEASYSRAIELWDTNAEAYYGRGNFYSYHEQYDAALADYARVVEINTDFVPQVLVNSGLINLELEHFEAAVINFTDALERESDYAKAYVNRGYAYVNLGEAYAAIDDLTRAIEIDSEYALAYFYRALAYAQVESNVDVISDYWQAVGINPNLYYVIPAEFPAAFIAHGIYLKAQGDYEAAAQHLTWGVHLDPESAEGYFHLGYVAYELGDVDYAVWAWQEAATLGHDLPADVQEIVQEV